MYARRRPLEANSASPAARAASAASEAGANEDRALVEKARFGDERAFERLVGKYQERTIHIARNFVLDEESARDVAQEAFLRVYRCLDRYDPKFRFYTWFYRLVVHLAIDHVRRHRRPVQALTDRIAEGCGRLDSPGRGVENSELRQRVAGILEEVPLKYRMLIVLRDVEGFTSKEISEIAGWNHATVRWRLHRARKLFRVAWEDAGYPEEF